MLVSCLAIGALWMPAPHLAARELPGPPTVTLERIVEVRRQQVVNQDDDGPSMFDRAKLELRFGIRLADGLEVVDVREPASIRARDSAGTDLALVEPGFFGRREYIETISEWDASPHAFTVTLLPSTRTATTFSLAAGLEVITHRGTKDLVIQPTSAWTELNDPALGGTTLRYRLVSTQQASQLVFRPGTGRDLFKSIELSDGARRYEAQGTMWNDQEAGFMFAEEIRPGAALEATLTIRRDLHVEPIVLDIKDQPLP